MSKRAWLAMVLIALIATTTVLAVPFYGLGWALFISVAVFIPAMWGLLRWGSQTSKG